MSATKGWLPQYLSELTPAPVLPTKLLSGPCVVLDLGPTTHDLSLHERER